MSVTNLSDIVNVIKTAPIKKLHELIFNNKKETNNWVHVNQELPVVPEGERYVKCLIINPCTSVEEGFMIECAVYTCKGNFKINNVKMNDKISYWCYLPFVPKYISEQYPFIPEY